MTHINRRRLLQGAAALPAATLAASLPTAARAQAYAPGFPRLMGMNIGAKRYHEPAYQAELARHHVVILDFFAGWHQNMGSKDPIGDALRAIKAHNPAIHIGQYSNFVEAPDEATDKAGKLESARWWLRNGHGDRVQWTQQFKGHDVNITEWAPADEKGRRYPEWVAERDYALFHQPHPEIDIWYLDNSSSKPLAVRADWEGKGDEKPNTDARVARAYRRGHLTGWNRIHQLQPGAWVMGNSDDVTSDEYRGQLDGVYMEALFGKSWSIGTWGGWDKVMQRYGATMVNTRMPRLVGFGVVGAPDDYRLMRYGLATCLLGDGYFCYSNSLSQYSSVAWFDEFDNDLGMPVEPPPSGPGDGGVWRRRYQRGMALVNPSAQPRLVDVGDGYRFLQGRQAPQVNTGLPAGRVQLPPNDGLVLLRSA
jgi:hypothetical protein